VAGVVLIGSKDSPVEVTGAHGGTSSLLWKCFTDGNMMWSHLQSFEHVTAPPGGNVGLHVHSGRRRSTSSSAAAAGCASATLDPRRPLLRLPFEE
jgi:hypothetical protein